jgi:hypothetical protein
MFSNLEKLNALNEKFSKSTLDELKVLDDQYVYEEENFSFKINSEAKKSIVEFIEVLPLNIDFGLSSLVVAVYDKLSNKETLEIDTKDMKTLQKLLISAKPKNIVEARILSTVLIQLKDANGALGEIEEAHRMLANHIVRKEQEHNTGLEFKEGDSELQALSESEKSKNSTKSRKK